jgi:hypothetical protein
MRDRDRVTTVHHATKPLTQAEIDRRIGQLASQIVEASDPHAPRNPDDAENPRPRWISAADLVKHLAPFMVQN